MGNKIHLACWWGDITALKYYARDSEWCSPEFKMPDVFGVYPLHILVYRGGHSNPYLWELLFEHVDSWEDFDVTFNGVSAMDVVKIMETIDDGETASQFHPWLTALKLRHQYRVTESLVQRCPEVCIRLSVLPNDISRLLELGLTQSLLPQLREQPLSIAETVIPCIPFLTPLFLAVLDNDLVFLKELVKLGAKPALQSNECEGEYQLLHLAARMDSHLVIPTLVQAGCRMDAVTVPESVETPLLLAAHYGNLRSIKALSKCPGFSLASSHGVWSLNAAVRKGNFLAVRFLVGLGCDVNLCHPVSLAVPLHTAARCNHPGVVRELLSLGADPLRVDAEGMTALGYASRCGSADVVSILVEAGISPYPSSLQDTGTNPFFVAILNGELSTLKQLVTSISKCNCRIPEFWSDSFFIHFALMARFHRKDMEIPSIPVPKPTRVTRCFQMNGVVFGQVLTIAPQSTPQDSRLITNRVSVHFLKEVLSLGSGVMYPEPKTGMLPIHAAAWVDDAEALQLFIRLGCPKQAFTRSRDGHRATPMEVAALQDSANVIKALVAAGCSVEFHYPLNFTPLVTAVVAGSTKAAKVLLQLGANANVESRHGLLPIQIAAALGRVDMIELLAKYGANIHVGCSKYPTETMKDIVYRNETELYPVVKNYMGNTLISCFKSDNDVTSVDERAIRKLSKMWLFEWGFINPPLILAIQAGHRSAVKKLIELGCDPNTQVFSSDALRYAFEPENSSIVSDLIDGGADMEWIDPNGHRAIYLAIIESKPEVARTLISKGCDVIAPTHPSSLTPFQMACLYSQPSVVSILSEVIPSVDQRTIENMSPLHLVLIRPQLEMKHDDGTASTCAMDVNPQLQEETVELLMTLGCNINATEGQGLTPLDIALSNELKRIVFVLTKAGALKGKKITEKVDLQKRVRYLEERLGQALSAKEKIRTESGHLETRSKGLNDRFTDLEQWFHRTQMYPTGLSSGRFSSREVECFLESVNELISSDVDACGVASSLCDEGIIPVLLKEMIKKTPNTREANGLLYDHLLSQSTFASLENVTDVFMKQGSNRCKELGQRMKQELKGRKYIPEQESDSM